MDKKSNSNERKKYMEPLVRELIVIPATKDMYIFGNKNRQLRVASYSRVSTDFEEQLTSFHAQKSYYTDLIMRTPEWKLAGTYADEGISGASAEKRPDFMKMIRHCKKGKIDLIITKSISRFARNTLDSIKYVRKLKAMGVGVLFEKENINTLEENSEVILTILSSLAQEELNSLSLNVKMGKRMAMQEGRAKFRYNNCYAYRKGADGEPEIIPEEAEIIKLIYKLYLNGRGVTTIVSELNEKKISSHSKDGIWRTSTIQSILENERYCGDMLLQKTFITDPISKKVRKNNGELPKYLIRNNHPAIISRETYEEVQTEKARRASKKKISEKSVTQQSRYSGLYALNEILICGECLTPYRRVVWTNPKTKAKKAVWRCINRIDNGTKYCKDSISVDETNLHTAIMDAINTTRGSRQQVIPYFIEQLRKTYQELPTEKLDIEQVEQRIEELKTATMALIQESILGNSVGENESRLRAMSDEIKALSDMINDYKNRKSETDIENKLSSLEETLYSEPDESNEYDDDLVRQLIDTIKVMKNDKLIITFKCGITYEQTLQRTMRRSNAA